MKKITFLRNVGTLSGYQTIRSHVPQHSNILIRSRDNVKADVAELPATADHSVCVQKVPSSNLTTYIPVYCSDISPGQLFHLLFRSRNSSVCCYATAWKAEESGYIPGRGKDFNLPHNVRNSTGQGKFFLKKNSRTTELKTQLHSVPRLRIHGVAPLLFLYVFMTRCLINDPQQQLDFYFQVKIRSAVYGRAYSLYCTGV